MGTEGKEDSSELATGDRGQGCVSGQGDSVCTVEVQGVVAQ